MSRNLLLCFPDDPEALNGATHELSSTDEEGSTTTSTSIVEDKEEIQQ